MNNIIILKHRADTKKIKSKFDKAGFFVTRSLNFKYNSKMARSIRAYAVNKLEADVYLNENQLL